MHVFAVYHFQACALNKPTFGKMADITRCGIFWFYLMKKRKEIKYHKYDKEGNSTLSFSSFVGNMKRRRMFIQAVLAVLNQPKPKVVWMRLRSDAWFEMVMRSYNEQQWYENFRVTKTTFMFILNEIRDDITRQDTVMRKAISAERRLALTLYYLASTAEYRTLAHLFGVSNSFVCIVVKDVCDAVNRRLSRMIDFPQGEDLVQVMECYEKNWDIPMCAGAIDGTHIPILAPQESHADYVNRKGYHSIIMQAVVDCRYTFRDVVIGWPGSVHDARVLSNSSIYKKGNENKLFPGNLTKQIGDQDVSPFLIGDPAYPLLPWLLKPYPENNNTTPIKCRFNYCLSRGRMTIENTYGRWKGRFPRFLKRVDMGVTFLIPVTKASCILHNICEMQNNDFLPEWEERISSLEVLEEPEACGHNEMVAGDAADKRETMAEYFFSRVC